MLIFGSVDADYLPAGQQLQQFVVDIGREQSASFAEEAFAFPIGRTQGLGLQA